METDLTLRKIQTLAHTIVCTLVVTAAQVVSAQDCEWVPACYDMENASFVMAFDDDRGVAVSFGGFPQFGNTYEWDGFHWRVRSRAGSTGYFGSAMAYDAARRKCVLFGGTDIDGLGTGDTWLWDGSTWTRAATTGPGARQAHAMSYDSNREVVVLFGGADLDGVLLGDTWEWDGVEWTRVATTGPDARIKHGMAYDSQRGVIVIHGGHLPNSARNDTWEWNGVEWRRANDRGPARASFGFAYDSSRGVCAFFGGNAGATLFGDTWEWNGVAWNPVATDGPRRRNGHAMVYDVARRVFVLHGGNDGGPFASEETWYYGCPPPVSLGISTACPEPGEVLVEWHGATPSGNCALLYSRRVGQTTIPPTLPCSGVSLALDRKIHLVANLLTDVNGMGAVAGNASAGACGGYLQLLDFADCRTSSTAPIQ